MHPATRELRRKQRWQLTCGDCGARIRVVGVVWRARRDTAYAARDHKMWRCDRCADKDY